MLVDWEIKELVDKEGLITQFNPSQLNSNSYNVKLGSEILRITSNEISLNYPYDVEKLSNKHVSPEGSVNGHWLYPNECYLGHTEEIIKCPENIVPMYDGRSSVGRAFVSTHQTAGFGDAGFEGQFTLEITVMKPTFIPLGYEIGQVSFHKVNTPFLSYKDRGRYYKQMGPTPMKVKWIL